MYADFTEICHFRNVNINKLPTEKLAEQLPENTFNRVTDIMKSVLVKHKSTVTKFIIFLKQKNS